MKKPAGKDRRQHSRYSFETTIEYKVCHLPPPRKMVRLLDTLRRAKGKDISKGGLSFTSPQLLLPGTVIEMKVPPSKAARTGRLRARVVWISEVSPEKYRVGVKFS